MDGDIVQERDRPGFDADLNDGHVTHMPHARIENAEIGSILRRRLDSHVGGEFAFALGGGFELDRTVEVLSGSRKTRQASRLDMGAPNCTSTALVPTSARLSVMNRSPK